MNDRIEQFVKVWGNLTAKDGQPFNAFPGFEDDLRQLIRDEIEAHEQSQWNDFTPQTLPEENELIMVKFPPESKQDPIIIRYSQVTDNFLFGDMWCKLPKSYQP